MIRKVILLFIKELTDLLVKTIKKSFLEDKLKCFLLKCNQLRENYFSNYNSENLEKIVKFLIPMKDDKILLYYQMFKSINHKIENDELNNCRNKQGKSQKSIKITKKVLRYENLSNYNESTNFSSQASNFRELSSHNNNHISSLNFLIRKYKNN